MDDVIKLVKSKLAKSKARFFQCKNGKQFQHARYHEGKMDAFKEILSIFEEEKSGIDED